MPNVEKGREHMKFRIYRIVNFILMSSVKPFNCNPHIPQGHDTVASAMSFACWLLAAHQNIQVS
jgi:hypothetical protein